MRFLKVFLLLAAGIVLGGLFCPVGLRLFPSTRLPCWPEPHGKSEVRECSPGPWGDLGYVTVTLEIPKAWTSVEAYTGAPTRWFFGDMKPEQIIDALAEAGLNAQQINVLMASAEASSDGSGTQLSPPEDMIIGLDPRARSYIYSVLSRFPENRYYRDPHRYLTANFNRWLDESGLPASTVKLIRQLAYQRGRVTLFSDVKLALASLDSFADKQRLLQILSRQTTLMPVLHVGPGADTAGLAQYWGVGGREAEVGALLESLKRSPGGGGVDILYLLPSFVRERIYTYPRKATAPFPDCHYSSMNFFNAEPDERYTDMQFVRDAVKRRYGLVTSDFRLGDLILLRDSNDEVVHSCSFIAHDIVFTKNGSSRGRPWVLMHLQDVIDRYATRSPQDMCVLRLRE